MNAGLLVTLTTSDGETFKCAYRREDFATAWEAAQRLCARQSRHYILSIEPCKEPPPPMSMEQWIAAGHTTD